MQILILGVVFVAIIAFIVGGYLFSALKIRLPINNVWVVQIITATVGAIIVLVVARLIT